jgi:hypothetical protein
MARRVRRSTTLHDVEMSCLANDQCQNRCERGSYNNFSCSAGNHKQSSRDWTFLVSRACENPSTSILFVATSPPAVATSRRLTTALPFTHFTTSILRTSQLHISYFIRPRGRPSPLERHTNLPDRYI